MSLIHPQSLTKHFKILNSPIVGIGLFGLSYWIWTKGVNSHTGTGS